jgi:2-polyprenyl-6-methoxyphenol hydroxylase-like FAD-dependent oxidoreductase
VRDVDYLIVGQGLAGSMVACLLEMQGKNVQVIDDAHRTAAIPGSSGNHEAPFAARQLIAYLEAGEPIHPDFDVCRKSLWE